MPVKIFRASGDAEILSLDVEINRWVDNLENMEEITHVSTAVNDSKQGQQLIVTIWYRGLQDMK
jgi:hypothetical protein